MIRERRDKEGALRESEARYRALVMAGANMVWRANAKGEGFLATPGWIELTGQSEDEVKALGWLKALHPKDRERSERLWHQSMAQKCMYENEFQVLTRDGNYRYFHVQAVPILSSDERSPRMDRRRRRYHRAEGRGVSACSAIATNSPM